jgi:hypothetical protein
MRPHTLNPDPPKPLFLRGVEGYDLASRLNAPGVAVTLHRGGYVEISDASAFRAALQLPGHGNLTALERMTLRGLNAIATDTPPEKNTP